MFEKILPKQKVVFEHVDLEAKFKEDNLDTHFPPETWPDTKAVRCTAEGVYGLVVCFAGT